MASTSIQCNSKEGIMSLYENVGIDAFSLWQGKQFLFKGYGSVELDEILEMLSKQSTNAIYTIKVYQDITEKSKIKSGTEDDGSFNFRLNDENQIITNSQYGRVGSMNQLVSEITALRKEIEELKEEEPEQEKPHNLRMIGDVLNHPAISPIVPTIINHIVGKLLGTPVQTQSTTQMQHPMALGNIPENDAAIQKAIERLKKLTPKLATYLTKLADLGEKDQSSFTMLITALENINV